MRRDLTPNLGPFSRLTCYDERMDDRNPYKSPKELGEARQDHLPKATFAVIAVPLLVATLVAVGVLLGIIF